MGLEQVPCIESVIRLCADGWSRGWHELNGGNLSVRLTDDEIEGCRPFFDEPGPWNEIPRGAFPDLGGRFFVMTGTGRHMRNVAFDPAGSFGILELSEAGDAWRVVWGLRDGRPSSEFAAHLQAQSVRARVSGGTDRVVYHAHPQELIAFSCVLPVDSAEVTHALWTSFTEAVIAIPHGVGVVPWLVPGSPELADASAILLEDHATLLWAGHGIFATGPSPDEVFGVVETLEKAAHIYLQVSSVKGLGAWEPLISDDGLRAIAARYGLDIRTDYLRS